MMMGLAGTATVFGRQRAWLGLWASVIVAAAPIGLAQASDADAERALFRQIFQELVEIDTTHSAGGLTLKDFICAACIDALLGHG
jgi:hypothetical protein